MSRYRDRDEQNRNNAGYNRLKDEHYDGYEGGGGGYRDNGYDNYRSNTQGSSGYRYRDNRNDRRDNRNDYRDNRNDRRDYRDNRNDYRDDRRDNRNNYRDNRNDYRDNRNDYRDNNRNDYRDNNRNDYYQGSNYQNNDTYITAPAVTEPPVAVTKDELPTTINNGGKQQKIKSALFNPKVREQLENKKKYKPYFIYSISAIQVVVFIVSIVINFTSTKQIIAPVKQNFFIGPYSGVLVRMGARYLPCMYGNDTVFDCLPGVKGSLSPTQVTIPDGVGTLKKSPYYCTSADICGFGTKVDAKSHNQWFRFIIPIFLHSGVLHLAFNLFFQIRAGASLEKDYGAWRMAIVYFLSGIYGFLFEVKSSGRIPTVGCSGSLYGIIACVLLDLVQNWKLVIHPWKDLVLLLSSIIISLGFGLLPMIDNFSHIGGFVMGILVGLIFLPSIIFSDKDEKIKQILKIVAVFFTVALWTWSILQFFRNSKPCEWCQNLSCPKFVSTCKSRYK